MAHGGDVSSEYNIMRKKKLVTICAKGRGTFSSTYHDFTYEGKSQNDHSSIVLRLPSFPENLVYYEHFEKPGSQFPNILSFLYVGFVEDDGSAQSQDFTEYKTVERLDFSHMFYSVRSLFEIVSKVPTCQEVRVFLSDSNLRLTDIDESMRRKDPPLASLSVKSVLIQINGDQRQKLKQENLSETSRIPEIFQYLVKCFPNLQNMKLYLPDDCFGLVRDLLNKLIHLKDSHKLTLEGQMLTCEPRHKVGAPQHHHRVKEFLRPPAPFGFSSVNASTPITPLEGMKDLWSPSKEFTTGSAAVPVDNKQPKAPEDVQIMDPPPKRIEILDIVSDEDLNLTPSKRPKFEREPVSGPSAGDQPTGIKAVQSQSMNSLKSLKEQYDPGRGNNNNWEDSSDDNEEIPPEVIKKIKFDPRKVKQALNTAADMKEFVTRASPKIKGLDDIKTDGQSQSKRSGVRNNLNLSRSGSHEFIGSSDQDYSKRPEVVNDINGRSSSPSEFISSVDPRIKRSEAINDIDTGSNSPPEYTNCLDPRIRRSEAINDTYEGSNSPPEYTNCLDPRIRRSEAINDTYASDNRRREFASPDRNKRADMNKTYPISTTRRYEFNGRANFDRGRRSGSISKSYANNNRRYESNGYGSSDRRKRSEFGRNRNNNRRHEFNHNNSGSVNYRRRTAVTATKSSCEFIEGVHYERPKRRFQQ